MTEQGIEDVALTDLRTFADESGLPAPIEARHVLVDDSAFVTVVLADNDAARRWAAALGAESTGSGWSCVAEAFDADREVERVTYWLTTPDSSRPDGHR